MKKLTLLLWLTCAFCYGQRFAVKVETILPDSLQAPKVTWSDLDNDGLLDILVASNDSKGKKYFISYKNDTTSGFEFKSVIQTELTDAVYHIADTDLDNDLDIIVSGLNNTVSQTIILSNDDDFAFSSEVIINKQANVIAFGDLTNDGFPEIVLSGLSQNVPFLTIFRYASGNWITAHDSLSIYASSLVIFDFDKDSKNDLAVSGEKSDNAIVSTIYFNNGYLYFKPIESTSKINGKISLADFNADGYFDVFISGSTFSGQSGNSILFNNGHTFSVESDSLPVLSDAKYLFGDFNSNGKQDAYQFGISSSGQRVHSVYTDAKISVNIAAPNATDAVVGDYEHDGDLDIATLITSGTSWKLVVLTNDASTNKGPARPANSIATQIYNRVFIYWDNTSDDHAPSQLITYDVSIHADNSELIAGEFDLFNVRRLTTSLGNQGTKNYLLLRASSSSYAYSIQSVDNAFHAGGGLPNGTGICQGAISCSELQMINVEACRNEIITFSEPGAMWFSFAKGLLSTSTDEYVYNVSAQDTLFSVTPGTNGGCALIKLYNILIKEKLVRKTEEIKYVCADVSNLFSVEDWAQIEWSSSIKGFLSHDNEIQFKTNLPDTLKVKLMNGEGCILQRNTILKLSIPEVKVDVETYQIIRGEQVQLNASGGISYQWTPDLGLSNPSITNPVASPTHSTQYFVTVKDSIGCIGNGSVRIIVEGTAFIPNLFTPNEDGQNDEVRIYGLADVKNFSFTIHNREGSIVFETQDVQRASSIGWDGTAKGNKQPNGVYYWKVKGQQQSGKPIQLNGKTSGSIVLIR